MLSDRDALLTAILANPEEDTPRLMFADWLEENNEPERAEFIRLQCELARLVDDASDSQPVYEFLRDRDYVTRPAADWTQIDNGIHRRLALTMRAEDLLRQHGQKWLPKLPKKYKVYWHGFHRGFAHRVELDNPRKLKEAAAQLREAVPAITLISNDFTTQLVEKLADAGWLDGIVGLELSGEYGSGLRAFGQSLHAASVRYMKLSGHSDGVSELVHSPYWSGLHTLDLSAAGVLQDIASAVFHAKHLRTVKRLHIRGFGDWTIDTIRSFTETSFAELVSLRITNAGLDDNAAELLANCPHLAKLRNLDLDYNNITGRGVTALLTSPHLANVAFLGLQANPGNGLNAERLAKATPGTLRMFHGHGCRFRTADVRALARCPRLRTLWYLDLDDNNIGTTAVQELVRGLKNFCPPILWLTHNRIDDRGAKLLANWKAAKALRVLHLKYNEGMTDTATRALLDSPNLTNLDSLGVGNTSDETEARMKARFKFHNILYG